MVSSGPHFLINNKDKLVWAALPVVKEGGSANTIVTITDFFKFGYFWKLDIPYFILFL